MSSHIFRVVETPFGPAMLNAPTCDACGAVADCVVNRVERCAPGDEMDGCAMLATVYTPIFYGWGCLQPKRGGPQEDYCPRCWDEMDGSWMWPSLDDLQERADIVRVRHRRSARSEASLGP